MVHEEISSHRRSPSYESKQGDTAKIPPYSNTLCPHQRKTCHTANGQQTTAHITTKGNKMPVLTVLNETLEMTSIYSIHRKDRVDVYTRHYQGDIIKHSTNESHKDTGQVDTVYILVQPTGCHAHGTNFYKDINT